MAAGARVLVLGAGVSGLTSALLLLERGHRVTLWAREEPLATTSAIAAALWYPFEVGPPERVAQWASRSLVRFLALARAGTPGVATILLRDLQPADGERPAWVQALPEHRSLAGASLAGYARGFVARVPVIETPLYLPWLAARVAALGGILERRGVVDLQQTRGFDAVVNCTGLGSLELLGDRECFPIRGQIARVPRGAVERALYFRDDDGGFGYIVPRSQDCVLGGTAERGETDLTPDPRTTERILSRCRSFEPDLAVEATSVAVGLRPGRSAIRLERERLPDGRALVHDYGHGGSGITLSWACAEEAVALIGEALA